MSGPTRPSEGQDHASGTDLPEPSLRPSEGHTGVALVVPTLCNFPGLARCLESIQTLVEYKLYVQNNWDFNYGVAGGWNRGIDKAISGGADIIVIMNDDIILAPYVIDMMVEYMRKNPSVGLVSGMSVKNRDNLQTAYGVPNIREQQSDFALFALSKKAFETVGRFDENFYPAYFEDDDYHYRTMLAGIGIIKLLGATFYHEVSATQYWNKDEPIVPPKQFEKNRSYYKAKWGDFPEREKFTSPYDDPDLYWANWRENYWEGGQNVL